MHEVVIFVGKDIVMATSKKHMMVYMDQELMRDFQLLYELWEIKCNRRGIYPSRSKFVEGILRDFVKSEKRRLVEEEKAKGSMKEG